MGRSNDGGDPAADTSVRGGHVGGDGAHLALLPILSALLSLSWRCCVPPLPAIRLSQRVEPLFILSPAERSL